MVDIPNQFRRHVPFFKEIASGEVCTVLSLSALLYLNEPCGNNSEINVDNNDVKNRIMSMASSVQCLRICPGTNMADETGPIDLSKFSNLTSLEIKRINAHKILLNPLILTQLQSIKCNFAQKAVCEISNIIKLSETMCSHLTMLDLQYNKLEIFEPQLLKSLPQLLCLNLSHNRLKEIDIAESPKLRILYASFNLLQSIPWFNINEPFELRTLHLHNNLICDDGLSNLKYLENLRELTLADNYLQDYVCLSELSDLTDLHILSLVSNPLSASKTYRLSSVKYLHENACVNLFMLDGKKLSKEEKHLVGSFVSPTYVTHQPNDMSIDRPFEILVPSASQSSAFKSRSLKNTRDAPISENIVERVPRKNINKLESPKKHLETKVQIENIRGKFGEENWLHKQAGSVIQNLMGLEYVVKETANAETNTETRSNSSVSIFASSPNPTGYDFEPNPNSDEFEPESPILDSEDTFESTQNQDVGEYILPDARFKVANNETMDNIAENTESSGLEDTEGTNFIFTAIKEPDNKDVFLVYNNVCFKEKDSLNVNKEIVWPLKNITSCSQINSDGAFTRVLVTFNSIKKSQTERIYSMETTEASLFCSLLREELESRPLSAMNLTAYRCIKCSKLFSVEKTNNNNNKKYQRVCCQACGSNAVLEMEEPPLPSGNNGNINKILDVRESTEAKEPNDFVKSPSQSSIGSANSLRTVHDASHHRRNDSDIEVISNPSQSSVEVLEVLTRKKSSEERQLVAVPELVSVPEQNVSNQGLTESSSSGSLTDSICTAYDGSRRRTVVHDDCTVLVEEDENKPDRNEYDIFANNLKNKSFSLHDDQDEDSIQLSVSDFSKIDHRVKLYLLTVVFKNNEDFVCGLKCHTISEQEVSSETKLIIFSTSLLYLFKIIGNTSSDNIESWLELEISYNITHIERIMMLPFQTGFHVSIKSNMSLSALLLDTKQTLNFMAFVDKSSHFKSWNLFVKKSSAEKDLKERILHYLEERNDTCSVYLAPILHSFTIKHNEPYMTSSNQMVAVILTESYLSLNYKFYESLLRCENNLMSPPFTIDTSVSISSLLNIDIQRNKSEDVDCYFTTLMFEVEDDASEKQIWKIGFASMNDLMDFTELVQQVWERLFGVQFPNCSFADV